MRSITVVALLLTCTSAWAQTPPLVDTPPSPTPEIVGARERLWFAALSGHVRADGGALIGTDIDVESTFKFDSAKLFNDLSAWVNIPVIPVLDRINIGYWFGGFEEQAPVTADFRFVDTLFTVGTEVDSELDFKTYTATIESFPLKTLTEPIGLDLGIQLGVKYFDVFGRVHSDVLNRTEQDQIQGILPVLGARFIGQFTKWLRVEAELIGLAGRYGDLEGRYFEAVGEVAFTPIEQIFVGVGYKMTNLNIQDIVANSFEVDLTLSGFFLTVGVRF